MPLVVYNSLTSKKEEFVSLNPPKVGMYTCGITAYDTCHIGHARAAVVFDMMYRYLKHRGFEVIHVRNYTDVDDKIINRANKEGVSCNEISERYIQEYEQDMRALGVSDPTIKPKATEHIGEMIQTIEQLIERGFAYERDGNVFFSVRKFQNYGKLSGKNIEELESGARVEVNESKDDPLDFALWKASKPGEPTWDSPWGPGRPGWHIECSAMSTKYLGQPFDIHGGGRDLIFPHHENEIAQAEGATGKEFVRYWLHNGFININAEKMSKSLGNIKSIREVLTGHDAEGIRLFLLSNHYRSPIDFTEKAMEEASASLDRFYETAERLGKIHPGKSASEDAGDAPEAKELKEALDKFDEKFDEAMDDDFNTARAVGLVFEVVKLTNKYLDTIKEACTPFAGWVLLKFSHMQQIAGDVLGIFSSDPKEYDKRAHKRVKEAKGVDTDLVERLIQERKNARSNKDFKRADVIRDELAKMGVEIKDRPDNTTEWKLR
ncbi:MAG: cysteine--tRNA ligase [Pseudomonadota bacterium]